MMEKGKQGSKDLSTSIKLWKQSFSFYFLFFNQDFPPLPISFDNQLLEGARSNFSRPKNTLNVHLTEY